MKTIVLGKNSFIAQHLDYQIVEDRIEPNSAQIRAVIQKYNPTVIINCIAFTGGANIDGCETNKEKTTITNLIIPTLLAQECYNLGIQLITLGSGCIYYGQSPDCLFGYCGSNVDTGWRETDDPILGNSSHYSKIKYATDLTIGTLPNVCTLRLRMPISNRNHPRNLINKLIKYEYVLDEPNSVTFLDDLVKVIDWSIQNNKTGIYHITNPEPLTHPEILEEYRKYVPTHTYKKINTDELAKLVKAPRSNCIINTSKLQSEGFQMTPTQEALKQTMTTYIRGLKQ